MGLACPTYGFCSCSSRRRSITENSGWIETPRQNVAFQFSNYDISFELLLIELTGTGSKIPLGTFAGFAGVEILTPQFGSDVKHLLFHDFTCK